MKRQLKKIGQQGLSIVETMIAMSLGAIVTVGVIQLFTANSETYNMMQGQSRLQESARFSLEFIGRGLQQSGYKGCFSRNEDVWTTLVGDADVPYEYSIRRGLDGFQGQGTGWLPQLTPLETAYEAGNEIDTSAIVPGTDVLTVRYISPTGTSLGHPQGHVGAQGAAIWTTLPFADLETIDGKLQWPGQFGVGDLALIHDCEKGTIFKVTGMTQAADDATQTDIAHAEGVGPTDNKVSAIAEYNLFESDDTQISAIRTVTFFIAPGAGVNNIGDTPLSLWRKFGTGAPVELVEGVEDLQILYGIDTDGDNTPNQYVTANLVTDFIDVTTVRVAVTTNSVDDVGGQSAPTHGCIATGGEQACISGEDRDGLIRRTFHQTVQIRNRGL